MVARASNWCRELPDRGIFAKSLGNPDQKCRRLHIWLHPKGPVMIAAASPLDATHDPRIDQTRVTHEKWVPGKIKRKTAKRSAAKKAKPINLLKVDQLTEEANSLHAKVIQCQRKSLLHANEAGQVLLKRKRRLTNGLFKPWIEKNFEASYETAACYMRIAKQWHKLSSRVENDNLTLADALEILRVKRPGGFEPESIPDLPRNELKAWFAVAVDQWSDEQIGYLLDEVRPGVTRFQDHLQQVLQNVAPNEPAKEAA